MEEQQNRYRLWIVIALIGGLLVGCVAGALAGGAVGYWASKRAAEKGIDIESFGFRLEPEITRIPEIELPRMLQGGALILRIIEGSPAERAGLRAGDMIIEVDGDPLDEESLSDRIADYGPGDKVELTVIRGDQERVIEVELGENPNREGEARLGIDYRDMPMFQFHFIEPDGRSFIPWNPIRPD